MEKYKSKYTETIMGAPAWSVVDDQGNTLATFMMSKGLNGEAKAKLLAEEMNREAAMIDIRNWDEKIYQAQCNVNKVAVAIDDMKDMFNFSLNKKDLAGKFDIGGAYNHLIDAIGAYNYLINAMELLKNAVNELPAAEDIEKALEMLSSSNK